MIVYSLKIKYSRLITETRCICWKCFMESCQTLRQSTWIWSETKMYQTYTKYCYMATRITRSSTWTTTCTWSGGTRTRYTWFNSRSIGKFTITSCCLENRTSTTHWYVQNCNTQVRWNESSHSNTRSRTIIPSTITCNQSFRYSATFNWQ